MSSLDLFVILAYCATSLGVGLWVARNPRTAGDYFLGARDLPAWAILLSIVATETSAITVISIPGTGARGDLTFLQLALGFIIGRIAVAVWLLPGYFRGEQETAYARLGSRFGTGTRRTMSGIFLVTRFLGDGVRIFASAIPLALVTGWSAPVSILVIGTVTMVYTWFGGFKAVVWADVFQLSVYVAGGVVALAIACHLAGGVEMVLAQAAEMGKLRMIDPTISFTRTYTLLGGLIGGAMLSAASHGTDHLIVQRLLASRSLRDARTALVGSGFAVFAQFLLFLLVGTAIWAAAAVPASAASDQIFPRFVIERLPAGLAGLVVAGILAAAMGTHSSAINALASSLTHDLYVGWTGRRDPVHLLRVGRLFSAAWAILLMAGALLFYAFDSEGRTPVVVLALSVASIAYGGLLGAYVLAGKWSRASGRDVIAGVVVSLAVMLVVFFASALARQPGLGWLTPAARLAWPWYVPLGTLLTVGVALLAGRFAPAPARGKAIWIES
ncbi:MAG TPA: sodium:solute symporter [Gemmatimonadales bacterium]|nr:sodium:solute symporter [Gemmatimonadales bacterium]